MQFPLNIELHRSKRLVFLLLLIHGAAVACCWVLPWPLAWRSVAVLLVVLSLVRALRPARVVGLRLPARDRLECRLADGRLVPAQALPESTVHSALVVLRLRLELQGKRGRRCTLVILPDQLDRQRFRRLRVCLRWQAEAGPKAGAGTDA